MNKTIHIIRHSARAATVLLLAQPITPGSGGGGGETGSGDFRMTADPEWDSVNDYTF